MHDKLGRFAKKHNFGIKTRFAKGHKLGIGNQYAKGNPPNKTSFKKGIIPFSKLHPECMPRGKNNHRWKKGKYKHSAGYIYILKPKHPYPNHPDGYVFQHRLVVEAQIGRYLLRKEPCHHINKIKDDNRPENLMAFSNNSAHQRFEKDGKVKKSEIIWDGRRLKNGNYKKI